MKTATYLFGALFALLVAADVAACPRFPIAKIRVIDQFGKPIAGAKVFRYVTANDSFYLRNDSKKVNGNWEKDSANFLEYRASSFYLMKEDYKAPSFGYRICAPGYADVLINSIKYVYDEDTWRLPLLEVVLYSKQLVKTNQSFHVYDVFMIEHELEVKDSIRLDKKVFIKEIQETPADLLMDQVSVRTYPNPVVNELHIEFSNPQTSSNRFVLHDANGKLVHEQLSEASNFDILMNWYASGTYFLTIYDSSNSPILRQQIVHQ